MCTGWRRARSFDAKYIGVLGLVRRRPRNRAVGGRPGTRRDRGPGPSYGAAPRARHRARHRAPATARPPPAARHRAPATPNRRAKLRTHVRA